MNSKHVLTPFLAAACAICLLAQPLFAATFGLFTYTDHGTTISIDDYPNDVVGAVAIPSTIIGKPVTSIGVSAFSYCTGLTSVTIPNSVTSIGEGAFFNCGDLTSVTIPNSVTSIRDYTFTGCSSLTSVTIPNSVISIGGYAFYNCSGLTSVSIGIGVTSIGQEAFLGCTSMTSISIPNSVTSIGASAFRDCTGLTSISIPNSVTSIGDSAFRDCTGLTSVSIPNSVTSIGQQAFYYCPGLTNIAIPNSVASIGKEAFYLCSGLTSVSIPKSVTSIGDYTFYGCSGLTSVTIPNSVTSIGDSAFSFCAGLTSVTIPNSVTSIGQKAFSSCTGLTSVSIPNSVTSIGQKAFSSCTGLTSVTIPNSVTSIGFYSFIGCTGLTSVSIGTGVTSIGQETFSGCTSLTSITIPNSVTSIGKKAFTSCTGLTSVSIGTGVTSIGQEVFSDCAGLTSVSIPNSVTSIGQKAFSSCTGLTSVSIGTGVTSIEGGAFYACFGLTNVSIPNSVTSIGDSAFGYCSSLTSAVFLGNAPSMGIIVFNNAAIGFSVFYQPGSTGFTTPTWNGYPCSVGHPEIAVEQPLLTNIPDSGSKSFGYVVAGSITSRTFTIKNLGNAYLTGLTITKNGINAADFKITANPVAPVVGGGSTTFTVKFAPTSAGAKTAAIHIANNDANEAPFDITLTGIATGPEITVEHPLLTNIPDRGTKSFGNVRVGTNISLIFTIKNLGNANLTGLTITKDGTNAADFTITANPVAPVVGGDSTTFTVKYAPTSSGTKTAAIHIANNDVNEAPFDITLTGTARAPEISVEQPLLTNIPDRGSKSFGKVRVGSNTSRTFTIKNLGNANLTGLAITKNGTNAADFKITANPVASLVEGSSTTFTVKFAPTSSGAKTAAIHIANNDANEAPFDITLTGTATGPEIAVQQPLLTNIPDRGSKSFGKVKVGSNTSRTFTIKNLGNAKLSGLTITKNGTNAADFKITATPVASVVGGGSTTFTVKFAPTSRGAKTAAIHIANNDANEAPFDITLTGTATGPEIAVQQPLLTNIPDRGSKSFGKVKVGSNTSRTFTIKNLGNAKLSGLTITKNGTNAADFKITATPVASVVGGGSTTFTVKFAPTSSGAKTAAIHIANNDANEAPFDITLTGTGVLAASPTIDRDLIQLPDLAMSMSQELNLSAPRIVTEVVDGQKFLTLVVTKTPGTEPQQQVVEVSPNLIDWYSGKNYTTVLKNNASILKVHDNTPLLSGTKRYIRLRAQPH